MATITDFLIKIRTEGQQLVDKLVATTNKLDDNFKKAGDSSKKFGASMQDLGGKLQGATQTGNMFVDSMTNALGRLGPVGMAASVAAGAFALLGLKTINAADQIQDLSDATGISASRLLNLKQSIIESGGSAEKFEKITQKLTANLGDAAEGNEKLRKAFKDLGVDLGDANGNLRNTDQLLPEVLEALAKIEDPALRSAKAVELLGKSALGIDWTKVKAGKDAIKDEQIKQLAEYKNAMEELANAIENKLITAFGKLAIEIKKQGTFMGTLNWLNELSLDLQTATIRMIAGDDAANKYYQTMKKLAGVKPGQQPLPPGVPESTAGAGRGNVQPPSAVPEKTGQLAMTDAGKQAVANAQAQTTALKATNAEALKYQQQLNDTIGMQQLQGDIERANLAIEKERATKVAELQKQIEVETNNKERDARVTAGITAELKKQIAEVNANAQAMSKAKTDELTKLQQQKDLMEDILMLNQMLANDVQLKQLANQNSLIGVFGQELKDKQALIAIEDERANKAEAAYAKLRALGKNATAEDMRRADEAVAEAQRVADRKVEIYKQGREKEKAVEQDFGKGVEAAAKQYEQTLTPFDKAAKMTQSIWQNMESAINNFVDTGKFKFKDFAAAIIKDLIRIELQAQAMSIFKSLTGGGGGSIIGSIVGALFGGKAAGGPVDANTPYVVGEKGPELFMPKTAGNIIPNDKLNGMGSKSSTTTANAPITNNYNTYNINALDAKSVAQLFAENRKAIFGANKMAEREMSYAGAR